MIDTKVPFLPWANVRLHGRTFLVLLCFYCKAAMTALLTPPPPIMSNRLLIFFDFLIFRTPPVFTTERWLSLTPMTPIVFMMASQQPEKRMKWLVRVFRRLQQMLRTRAALVQNQVRAYKNMPLFFILSLASGVASLPCLLTFQTSKIQADMLAFILVLAYIRGGDYF